MKNSDILLNILKESNSMLTMEEQKELLIENMRLRKALKTIRDWDLPLVERQGRMLSYESQKGSNGAREYIKSVAREALQ